MSNILKTRVLNKLKLQKSMIAKLDNNMQERVRGGMTISVVGGAGTTCFDCHNR